VIGRRQKGMEGHRITHIDMVPMVDCIMVLVIFLMISSSFVSDPGVMVQKPDVGGTVGSEQNILVIAITSDDRIWFDGQEIRADQVAGVLRQAAVGRSPSLIVRGDQSSSLGTFARVYDEAKRAGISQVQFATARAAKG
jgi:biopolymer transport protein ExbD